MTAKEIATDGELRALAAAGTGFIITPFYRHWHRATCPHVQTMTTGTQKWFAATTAELTDYLQQRITQHDTAKLIEPCPTCGTE
jgi:hypothetical protein